MLEVALFGGSFNPPHVAHQMVALYVLETKRVDQLWFVPCFKHPFDKTLASFEDRHRMCELAAEALGPRAHVSQVERELGGESLTLRTVRRLQAERPEASFSLVIGSDLSSESRRWFGADELRQVVPFITVARARAGEGAAATEADEGAGGLVMPPVSSTEIRDALAAGRSVAGLVPARALDYIYARGLYGAQRPA